MNMFKNAEQVGKLMKEAISAGPKGMQAIAAAINGILEDYVDERAIVPEILTLDNTNGENPEYSVVEDGKAYFIAENSKPIEDPTEGALVRPSILRLHSNPTMDIGVFERGQVGKMNERIANAGLAMVKEENSYVTTLLSAALTALGATNTVNVAGGSLTMDALDSAIAFVEDNGLRVKSILTRGQHLSSFSASDSPNFSDAQALRGAVKTYHGATVYNVPQMAADQVILIPDKQIGWAPVRSKMKTKASSTGFQMDILSWKEVGYALTLAKYSAITP